MLLWLVQRIECVTRYKERAMTEKKQSFFSRRRRRRERLTRRAAHHFASETLGCVAATCSQFLADIRQYTKYIILLDL